MNDLATRISPSVGSLGPDTAMTVFDIPKPVVALTISTTVEIIVSALAAACVDNQKANAEGDYLW